MFGQEQRGVRRAHSPDSYDNSYNNRNSYPGVPPQFRGYGPGQGHPFHKRHRGESYQPPSIEDKISRLGETGSRNVDIGILAKEIDVDLMNKGQNEDNIRALTSKICRSIISFPTRVGTYATLIGLISVKHYNVACQIINTLHASYPVYLEAQKWQEALTIIHLLSSLVNCKVIRPSALLSQFEFLLENTLEDNIPQARSDYYVYTVLSSLPFVALELSQDETKETFEKMLTTIENYLQKRSKNHLNAIRVWKSSDSTVQMDYLDSLWVQMRNFKANNWNETFLHRPYNDKEYRDTMASSLIPTNSPTFQIPGHSENLVYPSPRIVFRLYDDDVVEGTRTIPGSDKIERFCIENHIRNIISELTDEPRDCARHLINMYRSDQLPMKHILTETILGELFTLPKPKHLEILYHSLLFEIHKIFSQIDLKVELRYNFILILNEAVKVLFENLDTMNVTCLTRFIEWFSFHLNNIEFVYPWQVWADATQKGRNSPKAVFVQDILSRCIRFSFHNKIDLLVQGTSLTDLMPPEVCVQYKPIFADDPKAEELATTIKKLIVEKADGKTICETLNIVIEGIELPEDFVLKEEKCSDKLLKTDVFTAVILDIASKSLTHLSSAIGKFRNVFKALTGSPEGQIQLLQTMHSCLEKHPQLQIILVDKLLKAELVDAKEVCNWIFSDSMKPHHLKSYPWELLNNTISRLNQIVSKLSAEQSDLKEDSEEAGAKAKAASEAARPSTPTPDDGKGDGDGDVEMSQTDEENRQENVKRENEALNQKIEIAQGSVRELLLEIFNLFAKTLGDHIGKCETSSTDFMDDYYKWVNGRMQEVYYKHFELVREIHDQIRVIVDGVPSIGSSIINLNQ